MSTTNICNWLSTVDPHKKTAFRQFLRDYIDQAMGADWKEQVSKRDR